MGKSGLGQGSFGWITLTCVIAAAINFFGYEVAFRVAEHAALLAHRGASLPLAAWCTVPFLVVVKGGRFHRTTVGMLLPVIGLLPYWVGLLRIASTNDEKTRRGAWPVRALGFHVLCIASLLILLLFFLACPLYIPNRRWFG